MMKKFVRTIFVGLMLAAFMVISFGVKVQADEQDVVESETTIFEPDGVINNDDIPKKEAYAKAGPCVWFQLNNILILEGMKIVRD